MIARAAINLLLMTRLIDRAEGQTGCASAMKSLVQLAEGSSGYGSWDACCAPAGTECYLTRQTAPLGFEPCDSAHGARAGCNKTPQGTICMIGSDGSFSGSPCGASQIRACGRMLVLQGTTTSLPELAKLGATPQSILARGILGSQLCCSTSSCLFASSCTSQYNLTCVSDGTNVICIPFDEPDSITYAAAIVQDGHGCATATVSHTSPTSVATASPTSTQNASRHAGKWAVIGGVVGGTVSLFCIAAIVVLLRLRSRRLHPDASNDQGDSKGNQRSTSTLSYHGPLLSSPDNTPLHQGTPSNAEQDLDVSSPEPTPPHQSTATSAQFPYHNTNYTTDEINAMAARIAALEARATTLPELTHEDRWRAGASSSAEPDIPPPSYDKLPN